MVSHHRKGFFGSKTEIIFNSSSSSSPNIFLTFIKFQKNFTVFKEKFRDMKDLLFQKLETGILQDEMKTKFTEDEIDEKN